MRTMLALTALVVIGAAGAAYATDQGRDSAKNATERAIPVGQIKASVDMLGYDAERTKEDDGTYKMRLTDRASGGKVNAVFDANTGELMHAKLAREDSKAEKHEEAHEQKEHHEHKEHGEHREKGRENRD